MMLIRTIRSLNQARKMEKGDVLITRQLHPTDPKKDRTVIVVSGKLDPKVLIDAERILKKTAHARTFPKRRRKPEPMPEHQGYIPIGIRARENI